MPIALILSVVKSEALARSKFVASLNLRIGSVPSRICCTFQPAKAWYSIAFALSVALLEVVAPNSLALLESFSKSFPVAPEIALTCAIPCSKSIETLVLYPAKATIGADIAIKLVPAWLIPCPKLCIFCPVFCRLSPSFIKPFCCVSNCVLHACNSACKFFNCASVLFIAILELFIALTLFFIWFSFSL